MGAPEPVWIAWRREKSRSYRDLNSDPSTVQPLPVAILTALSRLPHPRPYSADLASSDNDLFGPLKLRFAAHRFRTDFEVMGPARA
jgi:hypothetical protein